MLKPYVDADAAWARYFLAQIIERARPAPDNAGVRIKSLLEPAAEKGLADAQWSLGTLYLRGAPGVPKDPSLAEALLRRAAERGNAEQLSSSALPNCRAPRALRPIRAKGHCGCNARQCVD